MSDNMDIILKYSAVLLLFAAVISGLLAVRNIKAEVPEEKRTYMDPLPWKLKLIWPLVQVAAYYLGERLPIDQLEKYSRKLKRSGMDYLMTPEQYFGLHVIAALLMASAVYLSLLMIGINDWLFPLLGAMLGAMLPHLTLKDMRKRREKDIVRALPVYLDFLTMAVQAGLSLSGGIKQAVEKAPKGPLRDEFQRVLRDIKAGMSRLDALREMADRLDIRDINSFVIAIAQAEKTGASIGESLKIQADQRRVERFQRAEKLAMEAPVKLIFPLVAFIFPITFVILFFPIAMKIMYEM